MKPHGNTGKRNAAKAPEKVKGVLKCLRFTKDEIDAQNKARGSVSWSKWARAALVLAALCEIARDNTFADSGRNPSNKHQ
jgi:hypothetical protein